MDLPISSTNVEQLKNMLVFVLRWRHDQADVLDDPGVAAGHAGHAQPHWRLARPLGHPGTTERNTAQHQPLQVSPVNPENRVWGNFLPLAELEPECISVPEPDLDTVRIHH